MEENRQTDVGLTITKYLHSMHMTGVGPAHRWNGDEVMAEIHKYVDTLPSREDVGVFVVGSLDKSIVVIATGHVVAQKDFMLPIAILRVFFSQRLKNGDIPTVNYSFTT